MTDDEQVFVVVAFDEGVEFEQKIGVFLQVVLARVAKGFVLLVDPPGGVEDDERQAVGQRDLGRAGETVVGEEDVAATQDVFDEAFLAGEGFQAAG